MECQTTLKNLKINKNKNIGTVIVVVEGEDEEFYVFKKIFTEIFDYNMITKRRNKGDLTIYESKNNKNSKIVVINTINSNISSLFDASNDEIYALIKLKYRADIKNNPVYIIWDRDEGSNDDEDVKKALSIYKSALDNEYEMNGLLLLNYPCVESYEISFVTNKLYKKEFETSQAAKKYKSEIYSKKNISKKFNENLLKNAILNMHKSFMEYGINNYDPANFEDDNNRIFQGEEEHFKEFNTYKALSEISLMLVDLGLINIEI